MSTDFIVLDISSIYYDNTVLSEVMVGIREHRDMAKTSRNMLFHFLAALSLKSLSCLYRPVNRDWKLK